MITQLNHWLVTQLSVPGNSCALDGLGYISFNGSTVAYQRTNRVVGGTIDSSMVEFLLVVPRLVSLDNSREMSPDLSSGPCVTNANVPAEGKFYSQGPRGVWELQIMSSAMTH